MASSTPAVLFLCLFVRSALTAPPEPEAAALEDEPGAVMLTAGADEDQPSANNLLSNGSFEAWRTGILNMPADWSVRLFDRADDVELVADAARARQGLRVMCLRSDAGKGVTLDAIPAGGVKLQPGQTYDITCWARAEDGSPSLSIEPGNYTAAVGSDWSLHRASFTMPGDADPQLGLYLRIASGQVLLDDVAIVPTGDAVRWPDETRADRSDLRTPPRQLAWHGTQRDPAWVARVPVIFAELMDEAADNVVVKLKLCDVLSDVWYNRIGVDSVKVVNAATGQRTPHVIVDSDRFPGATAEDELMFPVNVAPRSRRTYYVYYTDASRANADLPKDVPLRMARPSGYRYALELVIEPPQPPATINIGKAGGTITIYDGKPVKAVAVSPDTMRQEPVDLSPIEGQPYTWALGEIPDDEPGVWLVRVSMADGRTIERPMVSGRAMWASNNAVTIQIGHDDPVYDAGWAKISAARGERESFQAVLRSETPLGNVTLTADDLVCADRSRTIPADRIRIEYVEKIHVTMPWPLGRRAGWYRDPLVPWRSRHLTAGQTEVAWVTVNVPTDAEPGEYWGRLVAHGDDSEPIELPIRLEVFNFTMPQRIDFAAVLGGDIWEKATLGCHEPDSSTDPYRDLRTGEAALALARLLAEHHASPFYYHHDKSPYAVPWHYDPATGSATFDFTRLDENLEQMIEQWGVRELFFGGKFASGWRNPGRVFDWSKDLDKAWSAWWEQAYPEHTLSRDTPEGQRMVKAYAAGIAQHLAQRGWLDHAYIYITDEDKTDQVRAVARQTIDTVRETNPRLHTLVISNAEHRYPDYLDVVDAFAGRISDEHLARLRQSDAQWWGAYNSGGLPTTPLALTRVLGARAWRDGSTGYVNWAIWRKPDMLIDTNTYTFLPENAGYPAGTFVTDARFDFGAMGTWVYPWPTWEPVDSERSQTLFVGSIRLAALREAIEDYEYLRRATALANRLKPDAQGRTPLDQPLTDLRNLIEASHVRVLKFDYFDPDASTYYQIREQIGRLIVEPH